MVPAAARPSMDSRRTVNSVPRPSTTWTESPGRRRKTRERCRVSCSSKTTRSAVIASGLTWKRATRLSREAEGGPAVHVGALGEGEAALREGENPRAGADVERSRRGDAFEEGVKQKEAPLGAPVGAGAEGAPRLDDDGRQAVVGGGAFPGRDDQQAPAHALGREGLPPRLGPGLIEKRRHARLCPVDGETERGERSEVVADRPAEGGGGGRLGEECAEPRQGAGRLLLHDAEGALLPEKVGQALGDVGGRRGGQFPEGHLRPEELLHPLEEGGAERPRLPLGDRLVFLEELSLFL